MPGSHHGNLATLIFRPGYGQYGKTARGFSDKNFRLCPSTDGRPYFLGFENFLTGVTGRGGKEDGLVPALSHSFSSGDKEAS